MAASRLVNIITATDETARHTPIEAVCEGLSAEELLAECAALETFRRRAESLYHRVRALLFLYAIHRFHLPGRRGVSPQGRIPYEGYLRLAAGQFEEAIQLFLQVQAEEGPSAGLSSALAASYYRLGFHTLAGQVRRSVRTVRGNQWMFRMGHPLDHPLRVRPELLARDAGGARPILWERTPVRMDLTHCGWSDIFFLAMDFPEGAKVLNVSIDLGVHGRDPMPRPPVEAFFRVIDEPILRLVSVDLRAVAEIRDLAEAFDFGRDYLGLLKAAVIAAGLIPPGVEGSGCSLPDLLARLCGKGRGIELVSKVNDIPKGSRLAVSTSLLAALVAVAMRATGQTRSLTGGLDERERRLALARALLGEWLGGSGGGWQDSGGVWPGIKLITGVPAREGDPEYGVSRGCLLPRHHILGEKEAPREARRRLQESLVLVHGGMAQNVGPILEMVTEKYLLRSGPQWRARLEALGILDEILTALRRGDVRAIGRATTRNFFGPLQTIIPWATNLYTERLIDAARVRFGEAFWGFWMLGGMSGGGMGFIFAPEKRGEALEEMGPLMRGIKKELETALPFAMDPVVYDFAINEQGAQAKLLRGEEALMPLGYYTLTLPRLLRRERQELSPAQRTELDRFAAACRTRPEWSGAVRELFEVMLPRPAASEAKGKDLQSLLDELGFDRAQHEQIRADLRAGRIGLAQNRLPPNVRIEDVRPEDVVDALDWQEAESGEAAECRKAGEAALRAGQAAVVTLAAGAGTRWTQGAGVVKALHPFCKLAGKHRSFLETHLAKTRRIAREMGAPLPHVFTTSHLTHRPIEDALRRANCFGYEGPVLLSRGRSVGLRMIPTVRDLRFLWGEGEGEAIDDPQRKVTESLHAALVDWARKMGEAADYTDNAPGQCITPIGHWYEIPNMLRNGVLLSLLRERPQLKYLMLHNIDTVGADVDPALLGRHALEQAALSFEVIPRQLEDRGGGLARVDGRVRLVEGLAMPEEAIEFRLSYYNSMTTWIDIDRLLEVFGLDRESLADPDKVAEGVRAVAARMPTYITIKEVKKRWGRGQEDRYPVAQYEKLWGDMTALPELACRFFVVPRARGRQLKDPAQLDGWLRDGSAAYVERLGDWS